VGAVQASNITSCCGVTAFSAAYLYYTAYCVRVAHSLLTGVTETKVLYIYTTIFFCFKGGGRTKREISSVRLPADVHSLEISPAVMTLPYAWKRGRLSVRSSHVGIVAKWLNVGYHRFFTP